MNLSGLSTLVLERIGESPATPVFYPAADVADALNLGQRIFAFLTLCLEATRPFQVTPGNQWYPLQVSFTDHIVTLRCELQNQAAGGADSTFDGSATGNAEFNDQQFNGRTVAPTPKLSPAKLSEMAANNSAWLSAVGTPARYHSTGFGLLVLDNSPDADYNLNITYARMPVRMIAGGDTPEIPEPDHRSLVDFAVGFLRVREGGQELANDAPLLQSFFDAVRRRAAQVRTRSLALRYDHAPPELEKIDLSRALGLRKDLSPRRKDMGWTSPQ